MKLRLTRELPELTNVSDLLSPKLVTNRNHSDITKTDCLVMICPTSICNNLHCPLLMCLVPLWLRLLLESLKKYKSP